MNSVYVDTLKLVNAAIHETEVDFSVKPDWEAIYPILYQGHLECVTYKCVSRLREELRPDSTLLTGWKTRVLKRGLLQMQMVHDLKKITAQASEANIPFVIFKGISLARLYPEPGTRYSCDCDVLVDVSARSAMETLLQTAGYSPYAPASKQHVPVFRKDTPSGIFKIELHDRLWEDYEGKLTELLDSMHLTDPASLLEESFQGLTYRTLGYEEHLIYQIFHIAKHFSLEGLSLRYLTDLTLYVNAYLKEMDVSHFWTSIEKLHYEDFVEALFLICHTYLGMDGTVLRGNISEKTINEQLIEDILRKGKYSDAYVESWASTEYLADYLIREKTVKHGHSRQILFPSANELKDKFSYAKRHPVLLPVAWIHRFISALSYSVLCARKGYSSAQVFSKAEMRLQLMKQLGLVDSDEEQ